MPLEGRTSLPPKPVRAPSAASIISHSLQSRELHVLPPPSINTMTDRLADGASVWSSLHATIEQLLLDPHQGLSTDDYMQTYTAIYNHCTSRPSSSVQGTGASVLGAELYFRLRDLIQTHMHNLCQQCGGRMDIDLLVFYMREWIKYTQSAKFLDHLFAYLNRHWVKREIDDNREGVYRVHTLCLVTWNEFFFEKIRDVLIKAVLKQIETERNGEPIDTSMLKTIIDSFVALNHPNDTSPMDIGDPQNKKESVYRKAFEDPFFSATTAYYKAESEAFLAEHTLSDYMKKVETRLNEEVHRVDMYLHKSTMNKLVSLCESRLIEDHHVRFQDEFQMLLETDRVDDMQRMYALLVRRASLLDPLRSKLELYVRKAGLEVVDKIASGTNANTADGGDDAGDDQDQKQDAGTAQKQQQLDPKLYVDALLSVHKKYAALVATAFKNDPGFVGSLDRACQEYVNRNSVCSTSTAKSPEYLARYCDSLLKKSAKNPEEAELEEALSSVMVVFKYIQDKDVFQSFYTKGLAKRLVSGTSASDHAEELMISKLKEACGFEYTSKLQRMFQDMGTSKELNAAFRAQMEQNHDMSDMVDFSVLVLSTASWPFTPPAFEFALPQELFKTYDRFVKYYNSKHSGRKLTWLYNHSKGEIKAYFQKHTYTWQVSMYQMGIFMLYNNATTYTIEELTQLTKLDPIQLHGNLAILTKARILIQSPPTAAVGSPGTSYALNLDYKNKKIRLNLNVPIRAEQKAEVEETNKHVEEERSMLIQAAIVRIMKTRKTMKYVALMNEVISQLQSRFKPRVQDIKKAIEILLEKEYLERPEGEKDTFQYVA